MLGEFLKQSPKLSRLVLVSMVLLWVFHLGGSFFIRAHEGLRAKEPVRLVSEFHKYQSQRNILWTKPFLANQVIAGEGYFVYFSTFLENLRPFSTYATVLSAPITNYERDERLALNAYLQGDDLAKFTFKIKEYMNIEVWGPWFRSPDLKIKLFQERVAIFQEILKDPLKAINKYQIKYVALLSSQPVPTYLKSYDWKEIQKGLFWSIWEKY
ncbi:MAG: hypothetical protein HY072_04720 [Deltaproteobacteria bacterium]|nr:hypothetical protein [Deltaproteobacteria bacterium]